MATLAQLHKTLLSEWQKQQKNLATIDQILRQLKEKLTADGGVASMDEKALTVIQKFAIKDLYEISALVAVLSLKTEADMTIFDDAITQVLTFYSVYPSMSQQRLLMVGLNLMSLLASNRLADFHMLLEQIPHSEQTKNPYIMTPVRLEQSLMEGAYNKVVLTEKNIPSPFYQVFIRIMMDAVRKDIAVSIEKSFKLLSVKDSSTMLLFDTEAQVHEFAKSRGWRQDGGSFVFEVEATVHEKPSLDTVRIAKQTIFYAKQLEMIV